MRQVGVEEELLIVDPSSGRPRPSYDSIRDAAAELGLPAPEHELKQQQVEIASEPQLAIEQVRADLRQRRADLAAAAAGVGVAVAALGTSPLGVDPVQTHDERYDRMHVRFGMLAQRQLTCGMHVHVSIDSREEGVAIIDRIQPWLPCLLALSANSPYWDGADTGYASYRAIVWGQWPTAGPTARFGSAAAYGTVVRDLLASRTILDEGMVYFDARLSRRYPTVEVRVADVCADVEDALLVAALVRALAETAADAPAPEPERIDLLRVAGWQAARTGVGADLVDVLAARPRPAADLLDRLVQHTRVSLLRSGDLAIVEDGIARVLANGGGAAAQRAAGELALTVSNAVQRTAA